MLLKGKTLAMALGPHFEDLEFWAVFMRIKEEGATIITAGLHAGDVYISKSEGLTAKADVSFSDLRAVDLAGLLIPGGWAPDKIRRDEHLKALIQEMDRLKRVLGFICHAGWVAASAGIMKGRIAAGSEGIKDDMINAGAKWVDEAAIADENRVWGRVVADIPEYNRLLIATLARFSSV